MAGFGFAQPLQRRFAAAPPVAAQPAAAPAGMFDGTGITGGDVKAGLAKLGFGAPQATPAATPAMTAPAAPAATPVAPTAAESATSPVADAAAGADAGFDIGDFLSALFGG
jgi:hypothetical protein